MELVSLFQNVYANLSQHFIIWVITAKVLVILSVFFTTHSVKALTLT